MNCRDCEYWDYPLIPRIDLKFDGFCDHPKQEKREYYTKCPIEKERCQCAKCNNLDILLGSDIQLNFICKDKKQIISGLQDLWKDFSTNSKEYSSSLFWHQHDVLNYRPLWCPKCSLEALSKDLYETNKLACDIVADNIMKEFKNSKNMSEIKGVNHPSHYNQGKVECIDAMESAYGIDDVIAFCKCNAFKYQWRAGHKDNEGTEKDLAKAQWYQDKMLELLKRKTTQNKSTVTWGNEFATYAYVVCKKDYNPCRNIEFKEGWLYQLKKDEGVMYLLLDNCAYHTTQKVLDEYFDFNCKITSI